MNYRRWLPAVSGMALLGCNASYAPPLRSTHYGAPGRLGPGQAEVAVGVGNRGLGTGGVGLPVGGSVRLEVNVDASEHWVLGLAGLRASHRLGRNFTLDGELGAGVGRGGERCGNNNDLTASCAAGAVDGRTALGRVAGGGYGGLGLGYRVVSWLDLFTRARVQGSTATNIPATLWWSVFAGPELRLGVVNFYLGAGWAGYVNEAENNDGLVLELGASVPFTVGAARGR